MTTLSTLLERAHSGDSDARDRLFAVAYERLRRLAHARLRDGGRDGGALDTTALVHEAYLRCGQGGDLQADEPRAFFAYVSQVMRSIIVDNARERLALRRGGDAVHVTLTAEVHDDARREAGGDAATVLSVHEALARLAAIEPRLAQVVEMRYFGGYTEQEIAAALDVAERTVRRDWEKARLLLEATLR